MILPSLLEYSPYQLDRKIACINQHIELVRELTDQHTDTLHLHLDIVCKYFAKDRAVRMSLGIEYLVLHLKKLHEIALELTVHVMGDIEDMISQIELFNAIHIPNTWNMSLYVPHKFLDAWTKSVLIYKSYPWYDVDELDAASIDGVDSALLMTVKAGISGQTRRDEDKSKALDIMRISSPLTHLIVDGGWGINELVDVDDRTDIVSFGSFWMELDKRLAKGFVS